MCALLSVGRSGVDGDRLKEGPSSPSLERREAYRSSITHSSLYGKECLV